MGSNTWMVRAGRDSENVDDFLQKGIVALSGKELEQLSPSVTKESLLKLFQAKYPDKSSGTAAVWASQFLRFLNEIKCNDEVVTFDSNQRRYLVGSVVSDYEWAPELLEEKPHVRRVKWQHQVPRDPLGTASRNSLGAIQTLFRLSPEVVEDLAGHRLPLGGPPVLVPPVQPVDIPPSEVALKDEIRMETLEKADTFIEDAISRLDWKQMQDLVAGLLRSMGYRTVVAATGPDRGVDIFASPDGLGLQEPRIFVEVKHRSGSMAAKDIRAFLGGRKPGDRCLYVSTGGFSKDAQYEADRAPIPVTLVNLPYLRRLLVERYEELDPETASLVPLKKFYWPVT